MQEAVFYESAGKMWSRFKVLCKLHPFFESTGEF